MSSVDLSPDEISGQPCGAGFGVQNLPKDGEFIMSCCWVVHHVSSGNSRTITKNVQWQNKIVISVISYPGSASQSRGFNVAVTSVRRVCVALMWSNTNWSVAVESGGGAPWAKHINYWPVGLVGSLGVFFGSSLCPDFRTWKVRPQILFDRFHFFQITNWDPKHHSQLKPQDFSKSFKLPEAAIDEIGG